VPSLSATARRLARRALSLLVPAALAGACADPTQPIETADLRTPAGPARALGLANNATADTLAVGETVQLSASFPKTGKPRPVTWSTSNPATATVSSSGLVKGVAEGSAVVTATDGTTTERVTILVVAAPAPAPAPTTAPAPAPSGAAAVLAFMAAANVPAVSSLQAMGGAWAKYESTFATEQERRWTTDGVTSDANFYDRAMIYYVWWARTGNTTYLDRAHQLALGARAYLESVNYRPQPYEMMIDGVALHALVTGDQRSATTVAKVADAIGGTTSPWPVIVGDTTDGNVDSRSQARVLSVVLDAWLLKVASPTGQDYAARLRVILTNVLKSQSADGAYRWANQCYGSKPFMTGMLNDALVRYHTSFEADTRIPGAVKRAVDYLWNVDWVSSAGYFVYQDGQCAQAGTADLNNLIVTGFAFVARQTGDASYLTKGDAAFAGGVNNAWLGSPKHFNQQYTSSYRYLALRF
jgi:hypothetical protein